MTDTETISRRLGDRVGEYKLAFAKFIARGMEPFASALAIWPADVGFAYFTAQQWVNDDEVRNHVQALSGTVQNIAVPTKEGVIAEIYKATKEHFVFEDKLKGYKLLAELNGWIDKGGPVINNNMVHQRVMVVRDLGTQDEIQDKLVRQQQKLIALDDADDEPNTIEGTLAAN